MELKKLNKNYFGNNKFYLHIPGKLSVIKENETLNRGKLQLSSWRVKILDYQDVKKCYIKR